MLGALLLGLVPSPALAATGDLLQPLGAAGCISATGQSDPNDPLTAGQCQIGMPPPVRVNDGVSPDGKNAYVVDPDSGLSIFDRAPDGTLTRKPGTAGCVSYFVQSGCAIVHTVLGAQGLAVSPDGRNVYLAARANENAITIFDRDLTNGELTRKAGTAGCISLSGTPDGEGPNICQTGKGLDNPFSVVVSQDGLSVYVAGRVPDLMIFRRDRLTGALTQRLKTAGCISPTSRSDQNDPQTAGFCAVGRAVDGPVAISPDDRAVYVLGGAAVGVFSREFDVTPPETTITSGPAGASTVAAAPTFEFASSETQSTFTCSVDAGAFAPCSSPFALGVLAPGPHSFSVRAADLDANIDATPARRDFTLSAPPPAPVADGLPSGAPGPAAPRVPGTGVDRVGPVVRGLKAPAHVAIGSLLPVLAPSGKPASSISFSLSEPATVSLSFERLSTGRRVHGSCRAGRGRPVCSRYVAVGPSVTIRGAVAGLNRVRFHGRLARARALAAGKYRVTVIATDAAGNSSKPRRTTLTVGATR